MVMVIMEEEEKVVKEEEEERPNKIIQSKKSIEKRTQDLIERNSPSVRPSFLQLEQSKAKQSHVVSIHQKSTTKLKAQPSFFFFFISSLSVNCISHPRPHPVLPSPRVAVK